MTHLTENIIAIKNPDWGRNTRIVGNVLQREVLDFDIVEGSKVFEWVDIATLPPGSWEIVGESDKMDEALAMTLLEPYVNGWYKNYSENTSWACPTALGSFRSLLRYKGIETNHLIIKKID